MQKIFWDMGIVGILSDSIQAETHKHWAIQLFYSPVAPLDLSVDGNKVSGNLILVAPNTFHTFLSNNNLQFSMLILPGTALSDHLIHSYFLHNSYFDFSNLMKDDYDISNLFSNLCKFPSVDNYNNLKYPILNLWDYSHCHCQAKDSRIDTISTLLGQSDLSIDSLSEKLFLSPSRLAHLFKEETGIPLKSYIVFSKLYRAFSKVLSGTSITEAAIEAGFDSSSHFASTTKNMIGSSTSFAIKDSDFLKV